MVIEFDQTEAYLKFMTTIAEILGAKSNDIAAELSDVLFFELELVKVKI